MWKRFGIAAIGAADGAGAAIGAGGAIAAGVRAAGMAIAGIGAIATGVLTGVRPHNISNGPCGGRFYLSSLDLSSLITG